MVSEESGTWSQSVDEKCIFVGGHPDCNDSFITSPRLGAFLTSLLGNFSAILTLLM